MDAQATQLLLENGFDIYANSFNIKDALLWVAADGHEVVVRLLLENGAELESKDESGRTPLLKNVLQGHEGMVKLLLENGTELEPKDTEYCWTPLSWAAAVGHEAIAKLLLQNGAKLESKSEGKYGQTSLSLATENGCETVVKLLVENGAKLESKDECGQTPLLVAASNGHEPVVKLLLEEGAELESKDEDECGQTPLLVAAVSGHEAVVKLLLEKGAELEFKGAVVESKVNDGETPLFLAAEKELEEVVKLLLEKGAELESDDNFRQAPLSLATKNGREAALKQQLEKGVEKSHFVAEIGATEQFKHERLEYDWQIRVVELFPLKDGNKVCCKIHVIPGGDAAELDPEYDAVKEDAKKLPYDALSYTWGDSNELHEILIDDKSFLVRTNLFQFLKEWAPQDGQRRTYFWIDAISIDQYYHPERNQQVLRMTSIYKNAQRVPIWLGRAENDSDLAIEHLKKLAMMLNEAQKSGETFQMVARRWAQDPNWAPFGPDESFNNRIWSAIIKLFSRDWWTRVWIAQEATVPKQQNWVVYGKSSIDWPTLKMAMNLLTAITALGVVTLGAPSFLANASKAVTPDASSIMSAVQPASTLWTFQDMRGNWGQSLRLIDLIPKFRCFKATDDRDLVYALLGMAEIDRTRYPKPDYGKSETDVYTDVVEYLVSTSLYSHMLDILGYAEDYYDYKGSFDLNDLNRLLSASAMINEDFAALCDNPDASTDSIESFRSASELI